ncbi:MAG: hypothetical protein LBC39_07525 [Methanobrevibacter sp.]|jgi:hypothetical protein|nr:hypothetical protein [Candidatus Methanovirga aequatorialis]
MVREAVQGEKHPRAKLTNRDVMEIVELLKKNELEPEEIASMYNVCKSSITNIKYGLSWTHLTGGKL